MNLGIRLAQQGPIDAVWLLNNDTVVDKEALPALVNFKKEYPDKALIGSVITSSVKEKSVTTCGYTYYKYLGVARPVRPRESHSSSVALLFRSSQGSTTLTVQRCSSTWPRLAEIGGLPTENFLYYEELNLTHALGGDKCVGICRASKVIHAGGASSAAMGNKKKTYFSSLAAFRYTKRHAALGLPLVVLLRLITALTRDIRGRTLDHMSRCLMALKDLLKNDC